MATVTVPIASSALDLTKSLIDFIPASGTLVQTSREIYNWLQRERVDEGAFERCKELAKGLAYPNEAFEAMQRRLDSADRRISDAKLKAPLQLRISGSLGRLLAADPELCYITSTVAALTKFHDTRVTTEMLTYMILDKGGHSSGMSTLYDVQRAPIRAVLSKIVESVFLNVVNAGHDLGDLPVQLRGFCQHVVSPDTFAGIVMGIQRSHHNVVIRSGRFIADVTLWILTHFHGKVVVSVDDNIVFEKQLASNPRVILLLVQRLCENEGHDEHESVYADFSVGDTLKPFLAGTDQGALRPTDHTRQPLYKDVGERHAAYSAQGHLFSRQENLSVLNSQESLSVCNAAKRMIGWLLDLTVSPNSNTAKLAFKVKLDDHAVKCRRDSNRQALGFLLPRHPKLMHVNTGMVDSTPAMLRLPEGSTWGCIGGQRNASLYSRHGEISTLVPTAVISCFPAVQDMLAHIQPRCTCPVCQKGQDLSDCLDGCLRYAAVALLFTLIAHAMCDASGLDDVSGGAEKSDKGPIEAAAHVLYSIISYQDLRWDDWFDVIVHTATGYSKFRRNSPLSPLALQYGSYVIIAPWVDITQPMSLAGCFKVQIFDGCIRALPDDVGLVVSEFRSHKTFGSSDKFSNAHREAGIDLLEPADYECIFTPDTVKTEIYTAIFRITDFTYSLMTTVRARNRLQIVDPASVMARLAKCIFPRCSHNPNEILQRQPPNGCHITDFDQAVIEWERADTELHATRPLFLSRTIDTELKLNTLISLTQHGSIIRDANRCCLSCSINSSYEREFEKHHIISIAFSALEEIRLKQIHDAV